MAVPPVHRSSHRARTIACGLALVLGACHDPVAPDADEPLTALPRALSDRERAIVAGSNGFAFDLFREVARTEPAEANVFISPLSVSMALGMTMNGAGGESQAQLRRTLGFGDMTREQANAASHDLITLLRSVDRGVDFRIANSVWAATGFPVRPEFLARVRGSFDAEARTLDFQSLASVTTINDWVKAATNGKIASILDGIPADAVMYLINAIYFNGSWRSRFDAGATFPAAFTSADGSTAPVATMRQTHTFALHRDQGFRAIDLPYGRTAFTMTVLLPDSGVSVGTVLARLDAATWQRVTAFTDTQSVALRFPKFKLEQEYGLISPLQALGIRDIFDEDRADFSELTPATGAFVSEVRHKTFVDVHEKGTEAAAVTSVGFTVTCVCSSDVPFVVDRPFLFVIRERFSGAILFAGRIATLPR